MDVTLAFDTRSSARILQNDHIYWRHINLFRHRAIESFEKSHYDIPLQTNNLWERRFSNLHYTRGNRCNMMRGNINIGKAHSVADLRISRKNWRHFFIHFAIKSLFIMVVLTIIPRLCFRFFSNCWNANTNPKHRIFINSHTNSTYTFSNIKI